MKRIDPFTGQVSRPAILSQPAEGTLWEPAAHAKAGGPSTSHEAAASVSSRAKKQCEDLLAILREGPIESRELRRRCMDAGLLNVTARCSDLRNLGYVIEVEDHTYRLLS